MDSVYTCVPAHEWFVFPVAMAQVLYALSFLIVNWWIKQIGTSLSNSYDLFWIIWKASVGKYPFSWRWFRGFLLTRYLSLGWSCGSIVSSGSVGRSVTYRFYPVYWIGTFGALWNLCQVYLKKSLIVSFPGWWPARIAWNFSWLVICWVDGGVLAQMRLI